MPQKLSISRLVRKEIEVRHGVNNDEIVLMVQPDNFTVKFVKELEQSGEDFDTLCTAFLHLVTAWNLDDELSKESVEQLPVWLIKELIEKVMATVNGATEEAKN